MCSGGQIQVIVDRNHGEDGQRRPREIAKYGKWKSTHKHQVGSKSFCPCRLGWWRDLAQTAIQTDHYNGLVSIIFNWEKTTEVLPSDIWMVYIFYCKFVGLSIWIRGEDKSWTGNWSSDNNRIKFQIIQWLNQASRQSCVLLENIIWMLIFRILSLCWFIRKTLVILATYVDKTTPNCFTVRLTCVFIAWLKRECTDKRMLHKHQCPRHGRKTKQ